ncbi:MAG: tRNA (N(6)-L-threonylcarbamoyladenosine(37)-C(2))-methylthiotransferase MtaB [Tannerella sp.]|jgi:threonylcarbamoyladenosine tRNA methylthiotransferase MtaB|nr:tRNA (N(6)-L-threonylcarbamoyladenosine(37)-C(2))-methylthiotransferase MtaB [Tannerella sp.]
MYDKHITHYQTAAFYTLGCKLNFAETSTIGKELAAHGIRKAGAGEEADICVINTCSVTEWADKKSRQLIRRTRTRHPNALIIVTGCYAQLQPESVQQIEGVGLVLGHAQKSGIINHLNNFVSPQITISPADEIEAFFPSCSASDRTRHFLKVQDGCDYHCTYCTVPLARGRSRNGSIADLVDQAEKVAEEGGKEIVLTGVNTGDFGKNTQESFLDLLHALDQVKGIARYRISSIEPNLITNEIIEFVASGTRFAPHFHIPLQSGSDNILRLMHRRYDTTLFRHKIEKIKTLLPNAFIGVDVIVGTRGETDEFYETGFQFIQSLPISQLHVFTYSERPNTQALNIYPVVSPKIKQQRSKLLLKLSDRKWLEFYESQIGKAEQVLFEHSRKGKNMVGFTANYIKTEAFYNPAMINRMTDVRLTGWNTEKNALTASFIN